MSVEVRSVVKSADRVLDIFEVLAQKARPLSHTELAGELGIPKSSLSQLLANLVHRSYLSFDAASGSYELGSGLRGLVERQTRMASLPELAQPLCDRITRTTGESSSLNVRREYQVEKVCGSNSSHPLTYSMRLGELAPMHAVSSGRALLATFNDKELRDYLATVKLTAITKHTTTTAAELRSKLEKVRKLGVAWSFEEFTPGIVGVAVAAFHDGEPVGAFNIAMPKVRDEPDHRRRMVLALQDAAGSLEKDLSARRTRSAAAEAKVGR
jgi:DNA-binding IclR family transcriptional regulator